MHLFVDNSKSHCIYAIKCNSHSVRSHGKRTLFLQCGSQLIELHCISLRMALHLEGEISERTTTAKCLLYRNINISNKIVNSGLNFRIVVYSFIQTRVALLRPPMWHISKYPEIISSKQWRDNLFYK